MFITLCAECYIFNFIPSCGNVCGCAIQIGRCLWFLEMVLAATVVIVIVILYSIVVCVHVPVVATSMTLRALPHTIQQCRKVLSLITYLQFVAQLILVIIITIICNKTCKLYFFQFLPDGNNNTLYRQYCYYACLDDVVIRVRRVMALDNITYGINLSLYARTLSPVINLQCPRLHE